VRVRLCSHEIIPYLENGFGNAIASRAVPRGKGQQLNPLALPARLQTALESLYGHYEKQFELWKEHGIDVPPCFIIVCQNTSISKLDASLLQALLFHRPVLHLNKNSRDVIVTPER